MREELEMHRIAVSYVAAEQAEDAGKWRIGSAGVAVCGGCMPAMRLYSNSPCGDEATHRWGCSHRTLVRARVRIEARHPPQTTSGRPPVRRASSFFGRTVRSHADGVRADQPIAGSATK